MSKGKLWFALILLFAVNLLNFYDRTIPSAMGKAIRDDFNLTNTQFGLIGTAFIVFYALVGVPLGLIADKLSRKKILVAGVTLWSIMTAASGLATTYWSLFAMRLGVGVGEASCAPAANSMIGDYFPPKKRALALSIFMLGLPLGNAMGAFCSGFIAKHFESTVVMGWTLGWRAAFLVALVPGLICAVGTLFIEEPVRGATEAHGVGTKKRSDNPNRPPSVLWSALADIAIVFSIPTMIWLIAAGAFHNFIMYGVGTYLPQEGMYFHGLDVQNANLLSSLVYGLPGIPGMLLGGFLGDMIIRRRRNGRLLVAATALTLAAPAMWLGLDQGASSIWTFGILFGIGCMLLYVYFATVYSSIQDVIEPGLRGTAMAVYFCFMYLFGGMLGPVGVGFISDQFANRAAVAEGVDLTGDAKEDYKLMQPFQALSLHKAMYSLPMASLALGIVLFAASYTVNRDADKLSAWMRTHKPAETPKPDLEKAQT